MDCLGTHFPKFLLQNIEQEKSVLCTYICWTILIKLFAKWPEKCKYRQTSHREHHGDQKEGLLMGASKCSVCGWDHGYVSVYKRCLLAEVGLHVHLPRMDAQIRQQKFF